MPFRSSTIYQYHSENDDQPIREEKGINMHALHWTISDMRIATCKEIRAMYYIPIGMPEMGVHARGKNRKNNGPKTMNCWTFKFISFDRIASWTYTKWHPN